MLREEHAICVIGPARTSSPNIFGPEMLGKVSASGRTADIFDEPAHVGKSGICGLGQKGWQSPRPGATGPNITDSKCLGSAGM